jgi:paired amphipathic helix protein Sin3a
MRKNTFEEQLFKIEDEKYEYDLNLILYRKTIKLLMQLQMPQSQPKRLVQ